MILFSEIVEANPLGNREDAQKLMVEVTGTNAIKTVRTLESPKGIVRWESPLAISCGSLAKRELPFKKAKGHWLIIYYLG